MMMELEDVIKLLEEKYDRQVQIALVPQESVYKQYTLLGIVEGYKSAVRTLKAIQRREDI